VALTLVPSGPTGDELSLLRVSESQLQATADGAFHIDGTLTGTLDCRTGEFSAALEGSYCLVAVGSCGSGKRASFAGPISAHYDAQTTSFEMGTWSVVEAVLTDAHGAFGGSGQWNAALRVQ
jgi:hypothetical protein